MLEHGDAHEGPSLGWVSLDHACEVDLVGLLPAEVHLLGLVVLDVVKLGGDLVSTSVYKASDRGS